jgi:hypothetical protein
MDGAMILYDGMNEERVREVPPILGESLSAHILTPGEGILMA